MKVIQGMMWKMAVALVCAVLPLVGCSDHDDVSDEFEEDSQALIGFWLSDGCDENDVMNQWGLYFTADGNIYLWWVNPHEWKMEKVGQWEFEDNQYYLSPVISDNDYSVKYLKDGRLIIDHMNGWTGEHDDTGYRKMKIDPMFVNSN